MIARVLVALLSLAGAAWLAAGIPGARDEARARAVAEQEPLDLERGLRLYASARGARPDAGVWPQEAGLLYTAGRRRASATLLERAVAAEPHNVVAWRLLAIAVARSDPERSRQATARVRALSPPRPAP